MCHVRDISIPIAQAAHPSLEVVLNRSDVKSVTILYFQMYSFVIFRIILENQFFLKKECFLRCILQFNNFCEDGF